MKLDKRLRDYFSELGKRSGKARMRKMTAKQRSEVARTAARARWANRKKKAA